MAYLPRDSAKTKVLTRPWPRSDLAGPFDDDEKHRTAKQQNKVGNKIKQTCLSSKGSLIPLGNNEISLNARRFQFGRRWAETKAARRSRSNETT